MFQIINLKVTELLDEFFKYTFISKNDHLLVHSNVTNLIRTFKKKKIFFAPENIIDFLINKVGEKGSISFPTFNFDFCHDHYYSVNKTISKMGILSETARKMSFGKRTWNPVYSFKCFGNIPCSEIRKKNLSALGKDSLFGWLTKNEGKIILINVQDQNSMTIYHHFEEIKKVHWRYYKNFEGNYENEDNKIEKVNTKIYVRKEQEGIITDVSGMEKILWSKNLYNSYKKFNNSNARSIKISKVKKEINYIIDNNLSEGILYKKKFRVSD